VSVGEGVRVVAGERTGYAYSDDFSPDKILKAARTAACIAEGPAKIQKLGLTPAPRRNLYDLDVPPTERDLAERADLVARADKAARAYDPRVFQVQASYGDSLRYVLVATSDGSLTFDRQPMARLNVMVLARGGANGQPQRGYALRTTCLLWGLNAFVCKAGGPERKRSGAFTISRGWTAS